MNPSLEARLEVALVNQTALIIPWERLRPGPVGEYIEVVDYDPASRCFYRPVDLDHPYLLVQDGLTPSEASPQFHQQMVYAVAMATIGNFEAALGRRVLWAPRLVRDDDGAITAEEDVERLRIYPHALREANSYYSPQKKALLFGYFPATPSSSTNMPGGLVFTCLSPEIIAHETTHALIDGTRSPFFLEPTNPDVIAFHEAFADVVALFQSFAQPEWVSGQIAHSRGDLASQILLGELAQQSGRAVNQYAALRDAIGRIDPQTGRWMPLEPEPAAYETTLDPLPRAAILVAAIFDAYLAIYRSRVSDLLQIATHGSGVLPAGPLPAVLVHKMAEEASKAARHVLRMCIRALDYCPPLDITFGEFLRALMTADRDLVPADPRGYRPIFVETFRRRGIYPREVRTLSVESLCWRGVPSDLLETQSLFRSLDLGLGADDDLRPRIAARSRHNCAIVHRWLTSGKLPPEAASFLGLALGSNAPGSFYRKTDGSPAVAVRSVRPAWRAGPFGPVHAELLIEISQRRRGYIDPALQGKVESHSWTGQPPLRDFVFRGGCTLVIDLGSGQARYVIAKSILDEARLDRQRRFQAGFNADEPFANLLRDS